MAKLLFLFLSVCSFLFTNCPKKKQGSETIIQNVSIISMVPDEEIRVADVIIQQDKIAFIGKSNPHRKSEIIDGTGKFLMPGLTEMHAHIPTPEDDDDTLVRETLFLYLSQGVTTIRGMLGDPYHLKLKDLIKTGDILSPRVYTSSPSLNGNTIKTAEEAKQKVTQYKSDGYDFLKIHPGITLENWKVIESTAKEVGIPFAGHVPIEVGINRAIESGYATIDHLDGYIEGLVPIESNMDPAGGGFFGYNFTPVLDKSKIKTLVSKTLENNIASVPTQTLFTRWFSPTDPAENMQDAEMKYMPSKTRFTWRQNKEMLIGHKDYSVEQWQEFINYRKDILKEMDQQGVTFLLGSDAPQVMNVPGFSIHREMEAMAQAGISNQKIIESGTINPSHFFNANGEYGIIKKNASADLILVNGNPFLTLKNAQDISGVMVRGKWLSKKDIDKRLSEIALRNR